MSTTEGLRGFNSPKIDARRDANSAFIAGKTEATKNGLLDQTRNAVTVVRGLGIAGVQAEIGAVDGRFVLDFRGGVEGLPLVSSYVEVLPKTDSKRAVAVEKQTRLWTSWGVRLQDASKGAKELLILRRGQPYADINLANHETTTQVDPKKNAKDRRVRIDGGGWTKLSAIPEYTDWRRNHPDTQIPLLEGIIDSQVRDILRVVAFLINGENSQKFRHSDARQGMTVDELHGFTESTSGIAPRELVL